jgi:hypothetical protein
VSIGQEKQATRHRWKKSQDFGAGEAGFRRTG